MSILCTVVVDGLGGGVESMEMRQAYWLRFRWGDKPCLHPKFSVQFYQGMPTGDYVCTTCGWEFTKKEARALREARKAIARAQDTHPQEVG
jgi:hypothetical protein